MAYVQPTPTTFKAKYPEFSAVSDATVQLYLDDAHIDVDEGWGDNRARGEMLLAAHQLALAGLPGSLSGGGGAGGVSGPIKRDKVGDSETEFFGWGQAGGDTSNGNFGLTTYGRLYYDLMRTLFGGVYVANGPNGIYC